jgi:hypothetical protein
MQADFARQASEVQTILAQFRAFSEVAHSEISVRKRWQQIMCASAKLKRRQKLQFCLQKLFNQRPLLQCVLLRSPEAAFCLCCPLRLADCLVLCGALGGVPREAVSASMARNPRPFRRSKLPLAMRRPREHIDAHSGAIEFYLIRIPFIPSTIPGHGMLLSKNCHGEIANVHQEMVPATQSKQDDNELSGCSWLYGVHFALA